MKVKNMNDAQANYVAGAAGAGAKYVKGIEGATDWQAKAIAGEKLYAEKLQEAIAAGRRAKGLARVSNEEWKSRAKDVGGARIGQGMTKGASKWAREFTPYSDALKGTELPARTADGMQNLINRGGAVVQAMMDKKKELKG